jgi:hypothetical protein
MGDHSIKREFSDMALTLSSRSATYTFVVGSHPESKHGRPEDRNRSVSEIEIWFN